MEIVRSSREPEALRHRIERGRDALGRLLDAHVWSLSLCIGPIRWDIILPQVKISPVPDLIFEDQRDARVQEVTALLDTPERVDERITLHRVTVFATYGCNLACPYCKTIVRNRAELADRPQRGVSLDLDRFRQLLDSHGDTPIAHLHFTGGEASLSPYLPRMVALARARGVRRLSMTTNGTAPLERYVASIDAGLDELRISVDAADAALGRRLTLKDGAWERAVGTLRALSAERDKRASSWVFLIANTVVGLSNRVHVADVVRLLIDAGTDDIKLITDVDAKRALPNFPERRAVANAIRAMLDGVDPERFALLRRKLETVFASDAIGLTDHPRRADYRCYVPLTERTVDAVHYYPCSVYLREGGAPLGRIDEPQAVQRAKTAAFVRRADCLEDPICAAYCLYCTREYNDAANAARSLTPDLADLAARIRRDQDVPAAPDARILVVTPLGRPSADQLRAALAELDVRPIATRLVDEWSRAASALYVRRYDPRRLAVAASYERTWKTIGDLAEVWYFDSDEALDLLARHKQRIRERLPKYEASHGERPMSLHAFHVPDADQAAAELGILRRFLV